MKLGATRIHDLYRENTSMKCLVRLTAADFFGLACRATPTPAGCGSHLLWLHARSKSETHRSHIHATSDNPSNGRKQVGDQCIKPTNDRHITDARIKCVTQQRNIREHEPFRLGHAYAAQFTARLQILVRYIDCLWSPKPNMPCAKPCSL